MSHTNDTRRAGSAGRGARRRRVGAIALAAVFVLLLTGCFGDGTYRVGYGPGQLRPGATYSTAGAEECYWVEWAWGVTTGGVFLVGWDHRTGAAERQIHTIWSRPQPGGRHGLFSSDGCGVWVRTSAQIPLSPPLADKPAGMWRVPTDMAYGTWSAPGGSRCHWEILANFQGVEWGRQVSEGGGSGRQTIHVVDDARPRVHGFGSTGCGTWHRTG